MTFDGYGSWHNIEPEERARMPGAGINEHEVVVRPVALANTPCKWDLSRIEGVLRLEVQP